MVAVRVNTSKKLDWYRFQIPEVLIPIIHQVFADNEAAVADFKSGETECGQGLYRLPHESNQRPSQPTSSPQVTCSRIGEVERRVIEKKTSREVGFY